MCVVPLCLSPVPLPPTVCRIHYVSATLCPSRPVPLRCPSSSWLLGELWSPSYLNCIFLWVLEWATCRTGSCLGLVRETESAGGQEKEVLEGKAHGPALPAVHVARPVLGRGIGASETEPLQIN